MTAIKDSEKRGSSRYPADLTLRAGGEAETIEMHVSNVSLGGVYCRSNREFAPMTKIAVTLELPLESGVKSIRTDAVVVRSGKSAGGGGPYFHALFFQHMDPTDREHLMRFLGTFEH